jgi:hypothetical protein
VLLAIRSERPDQFGPINTVVTISPRDHPNCAVRFPSRKKSDALARGGYTGFLARLDFSKARGLVFFARCESRMMTSENLRD